MNNGDTKNFSAHKDFRIGHQGVGRQFSTGQISWHNLNKKVKENAKATTKLIRNEDMTKAEALQAKKKLKESSLPPALSTRSNDRVLRERK